MNGIIASFTLETMSKFLDTPIPDDLVFANAPNCRTRRDASTRYVQSSNVSERQPHSTNDEEIIHTIFDPFSMGMIVDRQIIVQKDGLIRKSVRTSISDLEGEKRRLELIRGTTTVPVPQVMNYYSSQDFDHLVMERLPGRTLESVWSHLSVEEKESIANQIACFTNQLRRLRNDDIDAHLFLRQEIPSGLSNSTDLSMERIKTYSEIKPITDFVRERSQRFDHEKNVFTHGDLDWSNILITDKKVSGIVDLECGGFLPPYCEWIAVKRLSDNHPWFELLEPRLNLPEWNSIWEVEQLISALSEHSQWALTPQDRTANVSEGWTQVSTILGACIQDPPLITYAIRSKHPWWLEHKPSM